MKFKKIRFQGAYDYTFNDVNIDRWGGDLEWNDKGVRIKGTDIPIRKSLWKAFYNEFMIALNSREEYITMTFHVNTDGGYMVKRYCGNSIDHFFCAITNELGGWQGPSLPER